MWSYFVCGAPCLITGNIGVCYGLANGTSGRLHSLTLSDGQEFSDELAAALAAGDTELTLSEPPLSVNVEPDVSRRQRDRLLRPRGASSLSLSHSSVVIPVKHTTVDTAKLSSAWAAENAMPTELSLRDHAVQLAFAITGGLHPPRAARMHWSATRGRARMHWSATRDVAACAGADYKVQGRTLDKLVLSIGERPFEPHLSLTSIYVLASRVRRRSHLRTLRWNHSTDAPRLRALRHSPELALWHAGYDSAGRWQAARAVDTAAQARAAPAPPRIA